jgi:hypothetical protein
MLIGVEPDAAEALAAGAAGHPTGAALDRAQTAGHLPRRRPPGDEVVEAGRSARSLSSLVPVGAQPTTAARSRHTARSASSAEGTPAGSQTSSTRTSGGAVPTAIAAGSRWIASRSISVANR